MVDIGKPLVSYDSMSFAEQDPSFWEGMSATYGYQYRPIIGAMYGSSFEEDDNFNVLDYLNSEDLEDGNTTRMLATARSEDHLNYLRTHVGKMKDNRETLSRSGWGSMITAGILDPMNVFSLPFKGVGIGARFLSGAKSGFVIGSAQEAIRAPFDPQSTITETGINITGSTALVGLLGGVTGVFSGRAVNKFAQEQADLDKSVNRKVNPNTAFDYKDNAFVNSPAFKAVPTPMKDILQGPYPQSTKKLQTQILADGGLTQQLNIYGQGTQSVWLKTATYMGDYQAHNQKLNNIYDQFMNSTNQSISVRSQNFRDFGNRLTRERIAREDPKYTPAKLSNIEEEFINQEDLFYTRYGVQMLDNGQLSTKESVTRNINRLEKEIEDFNNQLKTEKNSRAKTKIRGIIEKQSTKLEDEKVLQKLDFDPQYKGVYFPRYFNLDAVSTKTTDFKNILKKWYSDNPKGFISKARIKIAKLELFNENRTKKLVEKQKLLDDIEEKQFGDKKILAEPKRFKKGGPYSDKQFASTSKLNKEIADIKAKFSKAESEIENLRTKEEQALEEAVNETTDKILNKTRIDDEDFMGHGLSKHLRHRELDVPNHLLIDFIETDPTDVAMYYMMRTGSKIEFANKFKGKSMDDLVDMEELAMIRNNNTAEEISKAKQNLFHGYDRVVGTAIQRPDAINRRIARALTDWTAYAFLGRAGLSSLPELGMIVMQHASKQGPLGWQNLGGTFKSMTDFKAIGMGVKEVQLAGEALDMKLGVAQNRMYEDHLRSPFMKGISKLNEKGKRLFYTVNGLAPITQFTKMIAGNLGQHELIDRSLKLVAGTLDQEGIELLARYGLTMKDAKKIKALVDDGTVETSESGRLFLANTEAWGNQQLVRKYRGALAGMVRNTIINATPADKPIIIDGVVYARMNPVLKAMGYKVDKRTSTIGYEVARIESGVMAFPFQFWNYTLGATTKVLASGFDNERSGRVAGFVAMLSLGYMTLALKNFRSFSNMDYEDQLVRAIDQTGITGIYSDLFYMGLHARHRLGDLDREDTFIQPKYRVNPPSDLGAGLETATDFAGATPSYLFDVADSAYLFANGDTDDAISKALRLTPVSSLYGFRTLIGEVQDFTRGRF